MVGSERCGYVILLINCSYGSALCLCVLMVFFGLHVSQLGNPKSQNLAFNHLVTGMMSCCASD